VINKNYKLFKIKNPYKIWIIDDFFDKKIIDNINKMWVEQNTGLWGSGYEKVDGKKNILEQGMTWLNDYELMPEEISDVLKYFHTENFTKKLEDITGIDNLITDKSRNWSGMRTMLPNSHQLIHSDARTHPKNGLRKELTCLLYVNENYDKKRDKGCYEVWSDDMSERLYEIEPLYNRFVIFHNTDTAYHGVPEVGESERRALTFGVLKNAKSSGRTKALFKARKEDSNEVRKIAKKRLEV
jgi:hypothetical protein|tara:strand:- start:1792 stop:2514 length:723 start_codon:yes stop_codon:yes gene_type:complete